MKRNFSDLINLLVIVGVVFTTYTALSHQFRIVQVQSNSMAPLFNKDDLLLVGSISTSALKVGQIAILPSVKNPGIFYAHRIISTVKTSDGSSIVQTKGDANPIKDDEKFLISSESTPIYFGVLPISQAPGLLKNSTIFIGGLFLLSVTLLIFSSIQNSRRRKALSYAKK